MKNKKLTLEIQNKNRYHQKQSNIDENNNLEDSQNIQT